MTKSVQDISDAMREIDFCTLVTRAPDGAIAARPMSNNRNVSYEGDSWFFTYEDHRMIRDIKGDAHVGTTYMGNPGVMGLFGKPGMFIHVEGQAALVKDKAVFLEHWDKALDRWFPEGADTPGLIMIKVTARRIHYWDGMEEGEVELEGAST